MRWLALTLLAANLAVGSYLLFVAPKPRTQVDIAGLELNANRVTILRGTGERPADGVSAKPKLAACLEWGLLAESDLERAQAELVKVDVRNVRTRMLEPGPVWLVYLAPARSRDDADRRVQELDEQGVKGARVLNDERFRNAISLGVFNSEQTATAQQQRMREAKVRNVAIAQRNDGIRLSVLVVPEATSELAMRLAEVRATMTGTDVNAVTCDAG